MLLTVGRSPIGVTAPASPRTRRSTADAGKIPATLRPRPWWRDASSLGPRPTGHLEPNPPWGRQELLTGSFPLDDAVPYQKVKRVGHGFRNFANYRLSLLLHCGVRWETHRTASLRGRSPRLVAKSRLDPRTGLRATAGCRHAQVLR